MAVQNFMGPVVIIEALDDFGFFKKYIQNLDIFHKVPKKYGEFLADVFSCTILSWNICHTCDKASPIYVIIHVEKTVKALDCQMYEALEN